MEKSLIDLLKNNTYEDLTNKIGDINDISDLENMSNDVKILCSYASRCFFLKYTNILFFCWNAYSVIRAIEYFYYKQAILSNLIVYMISFIIYRIVYKLFCGKTIYEIYSFNLVGVFFLVFSFLLINSGMQI